MTLVTHASSGLRATRESCVCDISTTTVVSAEMPGRSESSPTPMLPPTTWSCPEASSIAPTSEVVVVLPAEPVMPVTGAGQRSRNNSSMEEIGTPFASAARRAGRAAGTPCET